MSIETIYALSSGRGPTGVAIIRVSGPGVAAMAIALSGRLPDVRKVCLRSLKHPLTKETIDQALLLFFKGPNSFTGEDVLELHIHGGRAVIEATLEALSTFPDTRMAERGEFARRGFENGKLDLLEVEGLADLIAADTRAQQSQALQQLNGTFSALYEGWRQDVIYAIALVESALDFSDEGDVPEDIASGAIQPVKHLYEAVCTFIDDGHRGEIVRDGFRVVIAGSPNAGKSQLLNALAKRDVAIVSDEAGTTRDVIEVRLDIKGLPVVVSDTAGLRETSSKVEQEGIRRSYEQADQAQLILWIIDGLAPTLSPPVSLQETGVPVLKIWNKLDVAKPSSDESGFCDFHISAATGEGLSTLLDEIGDRAEAQVDGGEGVLITRARHRELLTRATEALRDFLEGDFGDTELRAEDLRRAAFAIGQLTGKVDVEDILDKLFVEFCIGK